ncbi:outer membrane beta-barrel protein [Flavobacterium sp. H122]|uniref:outer membrane beta-barrel protein n=1 Tax=Flavobacterium sp. H122 TaxID=2529860 RepID=UPI0010AA8329|nr:outer membrane beta-barrel protein [Flavobacterium sp. H122]
MRKIVFGLLLVSSMSFAQNEKFMIGLHYVGDVSKEEIVPRNFDGILGLEAKYNFSPLGIASFQGGICVDLLNPKKNSSDDSNYDKTILLNPNVGVELDVFNSGLKPFINVGYAFYNVSYNVSPNFTDPDPAIQEEKKITFDYNSITINPGLRYNFKKMFYLEANYKFLPVDKNYNLHFVNAGLGIKI